MISKTAPKKSHAPVPLKVAMNSTPVKQKLFFLFDLI
jgi:hypothetical protein